MMTGGGSAMFKTILLAMDLDRDAAQSVDLTILGAHSPGVVLRAFPGSVADRVIREAPCPVLTVRHRAANRGARNLA
jgi:nucleotide-binding universal stress UspA family protein